MALSDPDTLVARLASQALVAIGAEAVPDLLEVLQNGTHPARLEAVRALAQIGDRRAIPLLMKVLEEDSTILHYWAENGLNRLGLGMVYVRPD